VAGEQHVGPERGERLQRSKRLLGVAVETVGRDLFDSAGQRFPGREDVSGEEHPPGLVLPHLPLLRDLRVGAVDPDSRVRLGAGPLGEARVVAVRVGEQDGLDVEGAGGNHRAGIATVRDAVRAEAPAISGGDEMTAKLVTFQGEARRALERGIDQVARAVKITLGPKGRNVVLSRSWGAPTTTNDGDSIASEIDLKDPQENIGAQLVKEVANKTNDVAGDGTTTATVLAQAMVKEGLRNVTAGANPMALKRAIEAAVDAAVESIAIQAKDVDDKGYISPYFVTDPERMEVSYDAPRVLLVDGKVSGMEDLLPLLEKVVSAGGPEAHPSSRTVGAGG
jgi:hypothetical protein